MFQIGQKVNQRSREAHRACAAQGYLIGISGVKVYYFPSIKNSDYGIQDSEEDAIVSDLSILWFLLDSEFRLLNS